VIEVSKLVEEIHCSQSSITIEKEKLREDIKKEILYLSDDYCEKVDREICEKVLGLPEYKQAETVFCFVGMGREINTYPILKDALKVGKKLAVPKCVAKGVMEAYEITSLYDLKQGKYGILEPVSSCIKISPLDIDLCIVPCLASGKDGRRLGYGGGYYDRYLKKAGFFKISLCRGRLLKDEIPVHEHDVLMDKVVSDGQSSY
jgi:5-formyltetrahydrofolate cyclo-ligase